MQKEKDILYCIRISFMFITVNNVKERSSLFFFLREYLMLFEQWIPTPARKIASKLSYCLTLLMNMMVVELTGQSPVLIGNRIHDKWMLTRNYSGCLNKVYFLEFYFRFFCSVISFFITIFK